MYRKKDSMSYAKEPLLAFLKAILVYTTTVPFVEIDHEIIFTAFSPFRWFKKGSCHLLAKVCILNTGLPLVSLPSKNTYWLTGLYNKLLTAPVQSLVYDLIFCPIAELQFSNFFQTYLLKLTEIVLNCQE